MPINKMAGIAADISDVISTQLLISAAEVEDELGCVLRMHLVMERFLNYYLKYKNQGPSKHCVQIPREFGSKLSLSVAFGFEPAIGSVLHQLNSMRNKLAHKPDDFINPGDLKQYVRLIDTAFSNQRGYQLVSKRTMSIPNLKIDAAKFGSHGNRVDFLIASMVLLVGLTTWVGQDAFKSTV